MRPWPLTTPSPGMICCSIPKSWQRCVTSLSTSSNVPGSNRRVMRSRAVSLPLRVVLLEALVAAAELGEPFAFPESLDRIHQPATQGFDNVPTPSTLTIMRSPGVSGPTPDGVPVVIRSPGFSVMKRETCSTRNGTGKISSRVLEC